MASFGENEDICEIWFQSVSGRTEDLLDRHIQLSSSERPVPIGRGSRRRSDRGAPEQHNALYTSPVVSREHAELYLDSDEKHIHIRDLSSTHGTFVNGQRLRPDVAMKLCCGDRVTLGSDIVPAGGPDIKSVTFEVRFTIKKRQDGANDPQFLAQSTSVGCQPQETSSVPVLLPDENPGIIIIDEDDIAREDTSCQDQTRQVSETSNPFVVPCDSEDFSDDISDSSDAEWYGHFGIGKANEDPLEERTNRLTPALLLTPSAAPWEPVKTQIADLDEISSCFRVLSDPGRLSDLPPRLDLSHIPEDRTGGESSVMPDSNPSEDPEQSSWQSQTSNDLESALLPSPREKLSIQNLISTPHAMSQVKDADPTIPHSPPVISSRVTFQNQSAQDDYAADTSEPVSVSEQSVSPIHKQGSTCGLKRDHDAISDAHDDHFACAENLQRKSADSAHTSAEKTSVASPPKKIRFELSPTQDRDFLLPDDAAQPLTRLTEYFPPATSSFLLGTIFGGIAMLSGLIALPESFFS